MLLSQALHETWKVGYQDLNVNDDCLTGDGHDADRFVFDLVVGEDLVQGILVQCEGVIFVVDFHHL